MNTNFSGQISPTMHYALRCALTAEAHYAYGVTTIRTAEALIRRGLVVSTDRKCGRREMAILLTAEGRAIAIAALRIDYLKARNRGEAATPEGTLLRMLNATFPEAFDARTSREAHDEAAKTARAADRAPRLDL